MTAASQIPVDSLLRLVRRMRPYLGEHRSTLALGLLAMIGATVANLLAPWPIKLVFDGLLMPQEQPDRVVQAALAVTGNGQWLLPAISIAILLVAIVGGLCSFFQGYLIASVGQKVVAAIRMDLYRHIQRLSHSFHDQSSSGDLLSRLTGDVRMMRDLLVNSIIYASSNVLVLLLTLVIMAVIDWRLTLAGIVILPFLVAITARFGRQIKGAARKQRRKEGKIANVMAESLSAIGVVKAFARESYEASRFGKQNNASVNAGLVTTRLEGHMERLVQVVLAFGTMAVIWYGVHRVRAGAISPGDLLVFTAYLKLLYKPIRKLSGLTSRVAKATASGERLLEIFELQSEITEAPGAIAAPRFDGLVSFEQVSFHYPGHRNVLTGADCNITPGQTVAIVGASGAGKSTAMQLLLRFYDPQSGVIRIDGQDIRGYTLSSLREQFAVVQQDSELFATSIARNIAYGRLDATDEDVVEAAVRAGADSFIRELPEGYDTVVGERGATLSGGQRQRIAIARAIVRDAAILILDEPLNGLDHQVAREVGKALMRAAAGRTTLVITHDMSLVPFVDRVIVVSDGRFSEMSPEALTATVHAA